MKNQVFNIRGMTCAACAQRIEKIVGRMPGVEQASVNLANEKLFIRYDSSVLSLSAIREAVAKIGYEAIEQASESSVTIPIGGMTCAACALRVEKAIRQLDGVQSASVNLATEKATVAYDPQRVRPSNIRRVIEDAGYQALEISKSDSADTDRARKQKAIRTLWTKFIIAAAFAAPLLYIAMAPMITLGSVSLPFPSAIEPMTHPVNYALIELFLTLPILGAGYKFYTVGYKALFQRSPNMDSLIAIGTTAAVAYSVWSVVRILGGDHMAVESLYFESAGVIIALVLLGKSAGGRLQRAHRRGYKKAHGACAQNRNHCAGRRRKGNPNRRSRDRRYSRGETRRQNPRRRYGARRAHGHRRIDADRREHCRWTNARAIRCTPRL